jgi:glutathione S-transferase
MPQGGIMLTIWGRPNSVNVQKVMWAIGEVGVAHRRLDVGGAHGGLDTAEYGAMNPNRRIPVVQDGETIVWESNACVRYIAARYGAGGLWPEDPAERARSDMWMEWMWNLMPDMSVVFWQTIRTPAEQRDMGAVAASAKRLGPIWGILEEWLGSRPFVGGDRLTIGDIPVGCLFYRYVNLEIDRPSLPNLGAWYGRLKEREAYRQGVMLPVT